MNIVVTGASTGIGAATVKKFASNGHNVIAVSRKKDKMQLMFSEYKNVKIIEIDFLKKDSLLELCNFLESIEVDILINNAGGGYGNNFVENDNQNSWEYSYQVNVIAPMLLSKSVIPNMKKNKFGHIFYVTSLIVDNPHPGLGNYQSAKVAEMMLAKTLKKELYGQNIKITDIIPGSVDTTDGYEKPNSLSASEVSEAIYWAALLPKHFNIGRMELTHINGMQA